MFCITGGRHFIRTINNITTNTKAEATGDEGIKLRQHISGGHYISVTSGSQCVDFRKWFQLYGSKEGEIKPTKKKVALRFDEWFISAMFILTP